MVSTGPARRSRFARRIGSDAAEDAAQAALIRIAGAFRRIDPERAGPYIITVAENLLRSECRRHAREARRSAPIELAETVEAPGTADGEADDGDFGRAVQRASFGTLPPELRDIILGRRPLSDYESVTRDWVTAAGDQIRKEFTDAIAAAK